MTHKIEAVNAISKYFTTKLGPHLPGYFNLVMATGIVSVAGGMLGYHRIAQVLFYINVAAYIVLLMAFSNKLLTAFNQIRHQLGSHQTAPSYFTLVAATSILGVQIQWLGFHGSVSFVIWLISVTLWTIISYVFFTMITISPNNPGIEKGINGSWLISVVATQSLPILGSYHASPDQSVLIFALLALFMIGCLLYLILITLIFYRLIFLPLHPSQLEAPYWINMGAVAISTLAGSLLIPHLQSGPLSVLSPFVIGLTVFFWSVGTWWIPLLIILGIWRHIHHKIPMPWSSRGYRMNYWSMVFPLGMYTVCTYELATILNLDFLLLIPKYFIFIALLGWLSTTIGLVNTILFNRRK